MCQPEAGTGGPGRTPRRISLRPNSVSEPVAGGGSLCLVRTLGQDFGSAQLLGPGGSSGGP